MEIVYLVEEKEAHGYQEVFVAQVLEVLVAADFLLLALVQVQVLEIVKV